MDTDRRDRRSYNLHEALELQLAATAKKGKFSAVVLTENQGITVAGAGNMAEIEEIAAFAPQLAPGKRYWQGSLKDVGGEDKLVTVAPIESEMGKLYMCYDKDAKHSDDDVLMAPRVCIMANWEANLALEILLGEDK